MSNTKLTSSEVSYINKAIQIFTYYITGTL